MADKNAWMRPVIASKQSSATFSDKEQIWADNAASSDHFGNVYICYAAFRGNGAAPLVVATSRDGGDSWANKQVSPAQQRRPPAASASPAARSAPTARVWSMSSTRSSSRRRWACPQRPPTSWSSPLTVAVSWTRPILVQRVTDPCFFVDPVIARCVMDGIAGARSDLAAAPSADIANGAPTGAEATDEIVLTWVDGRDGLNDEHVMVSYSTNRGASWSAPTAVEQRATDRGYYSAPALSPDGTDLYLVYNAFTTPFRTNTTSPRGLVGVVVHANIGAGGAPTAWTELHRGAEGDPRGSSQNNLQAEFLGDYVYAAATRTYGAAVWNDARNGAVCPAINTWRAALQTGSTAPPPAPNVDCPATFGNTDIFGGSWADPT